MGDAPHRFTSLQQKEEKKGGGMEWLKTVRDGI